jgi:lysophospholipase L1-like esterase
MRSHGNWLARHVRVAAAVMAGAWLAGCAAPAPDWKASWGTALMLANDKVALAPADRRDATLRQAMRLSLGGEALRVRISNLHGAEPLVIGAASVGRLAQPGLSDLRGGAPAVLRFGGAAGVTLAPGAEAVSDAVALPVAAGEHLALSLHVVSAPARQSAHSAAHSTQFIAPGNQVGLAALSGGRTLTSWYQVAGIEVQAPHAQGVLVAVGDSITDGSGSGKDRDERWPDYLVRRMAAEGGPQVAVINTGIGGNRMLRDDTGPNLLSRFERDVLARPGVTHALVLIGVNDMGHLLRAGRDTPEARQAMMAELQAGWRALASQAHARGVCLIAGTITPYTGGRTYKPQPHNEADRLALNDWLRGSELFDGVADFDAAVRDPAAADRLQEAYDSGDSLHLSPAGYRAMAGAVPIAKLATCRWTAGKDGARTNGG